MTGKEGSTLIYCFTEIRTNFRYRETVQQLYYMALICFGDSLHLLAEFKNLIFNVYKTQFGQNTNALASYYRTVKSAEGVKAIFAVYEFQDILFPTSFLSHLGLLMEYLWVGLPVRRNKENLDGNSSVFCHFIHKSIY